MFLPFRKKIESLIKDNLNEHHLQHHYVFSGKFCEVCGCVIADGCQITGKPEIREKEINYTSFFYSPYPKIKEKYIYTPYYCKIHAPKMEESNEVHK